MKHTIFRETGTDLWDLIDSIEKRARHNGIKSDPQSIMITYKAGTKVLTRVSHYSRQYLFDLSQTANRITVELEYSKTRHKRSSHPHCRGPHTTYIAMRGMY